MRVFQILLISVLFALAPAVRADEIDRTVAEPEAMQVLDEFMRSFNARDPVALADTYHYPHYRLARGTMNFWETKDAAVQAHMMAYRALPETGWDHSEWLQRRVDMISASKVHVATQFQRVREDGSVIGTYDSLYILIKKDGVWGIKMRSSFL